jgi:hypothetical protein
MILNEEKWAHKLETRSGEAAIGWRRERSAKLGLQSHSRNIIKEIIRVETPPPTTEASVIL